MITLLRDGFVNILLGIGFRFFLFLALCQICEYSALSQICESPTLCRTCEYLDLCRNQKIPNFVSDL